MRRPILAGNWKMNLNPAQALEFVRSLRPLVAKYGSVEIVVCPPYLAVPAVSEALRHSNIAVGVQNLHWAESGAYTGEIAPSMLTGLAEYAIIGHSERREHFCETDSSVNKKLVAALAHGLKPIVCVGENLAQNEAGITDDWVSGQVRAAFAGLTAEQASRVVVAYEPIWAIGTGKTATAAVANRVCGLVVRGAIAELYGEETAAAVRVQYGGSANEKNIGELMAMPDIDGALIGGASLKADVFAQMIRIAAGAA